MIDIFVDDIKCTEIHNIKEGYRIDFKNPKGEKLILVLNEDEYVDLNGRIKRRCETQNLISIQNKE